MSHGDLWKHWVVVLGRSLIVGAASGLLGGALIFFLFGFIGFSGASFSTRVGNGWAAALDPGISKGLAAGLALALGLAATLVIWSVAGGRHHPSRTRKWLSVLAVVSVVASNLESVHNAFGWDEVGIGTVLGIGLLVAGIVWVTAPWVLQMEAIELSMKEEPSAGGLRRG
jgi:hypothetical protein